MRLIIRADASTEMGSGHVMRCLTLAEELKKNGFEITFISRAHVGNLNGLISDKGMKVAELSAPDSRSAPVGNGCSDDYAEWLGVTQEQDARETINALGKTIPDWLIVDHYSLSEKWEKTIRPCVKNIMVIDDLANRHHDCDLLVDQNWFENIETRYDGLIPTGCTKLLGPEYALLRPEFAKARKKTKDRSGAVKRVFVFFGGSDPYNLTGMTLRVLSEPELAHLEVDTVIGSNNPYRDELKKLTASRASTNLHIQVDDMAIIMAKADLAIGSGGVNIWERMCLGLPALTISFAENHTIILKDLEKYRFITHLGTRIEMDETLIKKELLNEIKGLYLAKEVNRIYKLVRGYGTDLVAANLMKTKLSISIVTDKESWINDYIPSFIKKTEKSCHKVTWIHEVKEVPSGDICILLGCGQFMGKNIRNKNKNNIVVHESALPKGKGWSPLTWQILEGKNIIPITLFEAEEEIDSGEIYFQEQMIFEGYELIGEMRKVQAQYSLDLCEKFINEYPSVIKRSKKQEGESSFYKKRGSENSEIEAGKALSENFNLLRIVDNECYPAFFYHKGHKYKLKIEKY